MKLAFKLSVLLLALAFAGSAFADSTTGTMTVTANIPASCTVNNATLAFGNYDPVSANVTAPLDQQVALNWNCTNTTPAHIRLGQGTNPALTSTDLIPLRQMANGTNMLAYFLYSDTGRSTVWENNTGVAVTGSGVAQNSNVYGRVTGGQNVPAGSYTDSVVITLSY